MNLQETALIVIDSGFSEESIGRAGRVIAVCDLVKNKSLIGSPTLSGESLEAFAGDPLDHGSIVLDKLAALVPGAPFILVRAFNAGNQLCRTRWLNGQVVSDGWTEAYRWAVNICRQRGLRSVANCSFGGFTHAMDGSGWESFQLAQETGAGKPNHIVVAAAGPGAGRAVHASWRQPSAGRVVVNAYQQGGATYNLWCSRPADTGCSGAAGWHLTVFREGVSVYEAQGRDLAANFWNQRQQLTFSLEGEGVVQLVMERIGGSESKCSGPGCAQRFDVWVSSNRTAAFLDHVDLTLVSEPAVFPQVIGVGLRSATYAPEQMAPGSKPNVLLAGDGPVSFRTPEVTAASARLLMETEVGLDVGQMSALFGKFPDCTLLSNGVRV